jgi:oligopeptide transport system substrate-binding protein
MLQAGCFKSQNETNKSFRLSLLSQPESLDPLHVTPTSSSYILDALYLPLMLYTEGGLVPAGADKCFFNTPLKVTCELNPLRKFSTGEPIEAKHYLNTFQKMFLEPNVMSDYFLKIKNASAILKKEKDISTLGVAFENPMRIIFELEKKDADFLYRLILPSVSARRNLENLDGTVTTGYYVIDKVKPFDKLSLKPHPFFEAHEKRPMIEFLIVPNDLTARNLYETRELNFLPRLTFEQIQIYKNQKGFFFSPFLRADYIGFNRNKISKPDRKRAALSPDYDVISKLVNAMGPLGCPGIPTSYFIHRPCFKKDLNQFLKDDFQPAKIPHTLAYSLLGGDDIEKNMQWFQAEWKKSGLITELQSYEQSVYTQKLKTDPPAIFRRGFNLARPTCLALLENFVTDNPNNYIRFDNKEFNQIVQRMNENYNPIHNSSRTTPAQKESLPTYKENDLNKQLCQKGFELLMDDYALIPMGEIHFSMVHDLKFDGFRINSMNHLDLKDLRRK